MAIAPNGSEGRTLSNLASPRAVPPRRGLLLELVTFERLLTAPLSHLIYWCGLALISLVAFGAVGAAVGLWIRSGFGEGLLLALPTIVIGFLVAGALALIWRAFCEFFVAVFQIADDLRALRREAETQRLAPAARPASAPTATAAPPPSSPDSFSPGWRST